MAKKVLKIATFGLLGSKLLGGKKPKGPEQGPTVMPLPDDEAVKRARKASIAKQMSRGGRSSTILTDDGDSLGGY